VLQVALCRMALRGCRAGPCRRGGLARCGSGGSTTSSAYSGSVLASVNQSALGRACAGRLQLIRGVWSGRKLSQGELPQIHLGELRCRSDGRDATGALMR
jgi:hypothetical protein